ncbi:MAG: bifunctional 4-hydroxy-2-oxoglutarate aldolase/2-dehydro-3-deoxy-phosphogluconate aldolase [Chloroflexi bacterium]|nr:bifunctional 4-hydroxy-2-oxoglutarate aldolase/2-dehydro-3-deoxy-phosphogluconate aldolase [Chloroflexota bacterium]
MTSFSRFNKTSAFSTILETGIIAIMRANSPDSLLAAAEALQAGGVLAIEVTLTTPGALRVIEQAVVKFGHEAVFGAGTVLDPESAKAAIQAGAQFIVCPTLNLKTIELCKRYSVPVLPGAYTPTEILTAWEAGADMVKLFPADIGGPAYLRAVKAPLPQVSIAPTGGVELNNARDFIRAGADALGIGSSLVNNTLLEAGDFAAITEQARRFREAVDAGCQEAG